MQGPTHSAPVLVLQHTLEDGPGYLGEWLDRQGVPWHVFCAEAGQAYPASMQGYAALAVLGGEWSANDDRPSLRQAEALIREADRLGLSVIGHCLGGQLIAQAFGGQVRRLPQPEVGWLEIQVRSDPLAADWLGGPGSRTVYQWHYDGFVDLPASARLLASSSACAHQAFAFGRHLAMQFHIEITPAKIGAWLANPGQVYPQAVHRHPDSVQDETAMRHATTRYQAGSQAMADHIYAAWKRRWART